VVRNDFVDFIMELIKRGKNEAQEDTPSTKNPKKEATFGEFQSRVTIRENKKTRKLSIRITTESIQVETNSV